MCPESLAAHIPHYTHPPNCALLRPPARPAARPGAAEDMWHAYNLIREGDHVTATTFRKVQVG